MTNQAINPPVIINNGEHTNAIAIASFISLSSVGVFP
jgi:hypothetical protein